MAEDEVVRRAQQLAAKAKREEEEDAAWRLRKQAEAEARKQAKDSALERFGHDVITALRARTQIGVVFEGGVFSHFADAEPFVAQKPILEVTVKLARTNADPTFCVSDIGGKNTWQGDPTEARKHCADRVVDHLAKSAFLGEKFLAPEVAKVRLTQQRARQAAEDERRKVRARVLGIVATIILGTLVAAGWVALRFAKFEIRHFVGDWFGASRE